MDRFSELPMLSVSTTVRSVGHLHTLRTHRVDARLLCPRFPSRQVHLVSNKVNTQDFKFRVCNR